MSDAFELCVGHFHFMLDIFLFNMKTLDSVIKNSHIYAKIRDILTPTQTFGLVDNLTMCQTFCLTFSAKTSDIRSKTSDMSGKKRFFIFTAIYMYAVYTVFP